MTINARLRLPILALLIVFGFPIFSVAQLIEVSAEIQPILPTSEDVVTVDLRGYSSGHDNPRVAVQGHDITVTLDRHSCHIPEGCPWVAHTVLGQFEPGDYELIVKSSTVVVAREHFTVTTQPVVRSVSPRMLSPDGGTVVRIAGLNLDIGDLDCTGIPCPTEIVSFGDRSANILERSADELVVVSPPAPPGPVDVSVIRADGVVARLKDAVLYGPFALERWMLPVAGLDPVSGSLESSWQIEAWLGNPTDRPIRQMAILSYGIDFWLIGPGEISYVYASPRIEGGPAFLYIDSQNGKRMNRSLRVRDTSRTSGALGVSIPIVTPEDLYDGKLELLDVPVHGSHRIMLRIYDFAGEYGRSAHISVRSMESWRNREIASGWVSTTRSDNPDEPYPQSPGYAQIDLTSMFPEILGYDSVRIDVESPFIPGLWAFATVTHNVSQEVTVVTPK